MRLGTVILPERPWADAAGMWRDAEALGISHAWTYDHLAWRSLRDSSWFAAVPVLAAAATVTSSLRLGTLVASPNFRHPVPLAREVLALDDISEGRLDLGLGAGGEGWDATILGQAARSPAERSARFAEFVALLDRLLTEREVTDVGRYYSANEARSYPGCRQQPRVPFFVAATGPKAMAVAAAYGDAWVTTGPKAPQQRLNPVDGARAVSHQLAVLREACEARGRDVASIRRLVLTGLALDPGISSEQEFADAIGAYGEVGVTDLVVHWPRSEEPFQADRAVFERVISANSGVKAERDWVALVAAERCPECGLHAGGLDREALASAFEEQGRMWAALLRDTPDAELRAHRLAGVWSALEYGAHVRDVLRTFAERVERMLAEERPTFGWWDHEAAAVEERYNEQSPAVVAADLDAQAARVASIARRISHHEWVRSGTRRDDEVFTVEGILRFGLHEAHHHLWDAQRAVEAP